MTFRRALAIIMSFVVIGGGAIAAKSQALEDQRAELVAQADSLQTQIASAGARGGYIESLIAHHEDEKADLDAVLAARPDFVAEVAALSDALEKAKGKIDTAAHLAAAIATQDAVLVERADPVVVTNATATIHALTEKVSGELGTWEAAQRRTPAAAGPLWSSSGPDGYARVRAALDRVGGGGVGLYESASCAGGSAPACANSNGYIKYRADVAGWNESRLNWAMAHELGHIYQFKVWGTLNSSSAYQSMFGGDPEFLANCMALVRGYPGSVGCDGDQQIWASAIWVGAVR
ncbi:hypothetical protein [Microbacterium sp. A84]|uniref:hypothetical protein n=1 Tax=Microbacterium sp. A84 TaxID=3450715 RepID=UPI003F43F9DA